MFTFKGISVVIDEGEGLLDFFSCRVSHKYFSCSEPDSTIEGHLTFQAAGFMLAIPVSCQLLGQDINFQCSTELYAYCQSISTPGYRLTSADALYSIPAWISTPIPSTSIDSLLYKSYLPNIESIVRKAARFVSNAELRHSALNLPQRRRALTFKTLHLELEDIRALCMSMPPTDLITHLNLPLTLHGKPLTVLFRFIFEHILGRQLFLAFSLSYYNALPITSFDYEFDLWGREDPLSLSYFQQPFTELKRIASESVVPHPSRCTSEELVERLTIATRRFSHLLSLPTIDASHLWLLFETNTPNPHLLTLPIHRRIWNAIAARFGSAFAHSFSNRLIVCTSLQKFRTFSSSSVDADSWLQIVQNVETTWPSVPNAKVVHNCIRKYRHRLIVPPTYTCCSCSRQRFGLSTIAVLPCESLFSAFEILHPIEPTVIRYMTSKYASLSPFRIIGRALLDSRGFLIQGAKPEDTLYVLCLDCHQSLSHCKLPRFSLANHLFTGILPLELYHATYAEEQACALFRNHICVQRMYQTDDDTASRILFGNSCAFPQNVVSTANVLPNTPSSVLSHLSLVFVGSRKITKDELRSYRQYNVRRDVIWALLMFFRQFHALYQKLPPFSKDFLNLYPVDDLVPGIEDIIVYDAETSTSSAFLEETAGFQTHPAVEFIKSIGTDGSSSIYMERSGVCDSNFVDIPSRLLDISAMANLVRPTMTVDLPDLAIFRGQQPLNEYENPDLFPGMFPTLFPLGLGGFELPQRREPLAFRTQAEYFLDVTGKSFRAHYSYLFAAVNIFQRREGHRSTHFAITRSSFPKLAPRLLSVQPETLSRLAERYQSHSTASLSGEEQAAMDLFKQMNTIAAKVPGSDAAKLSIRKEIRAYIQFFGVAHMFLTINPSAVHSPVFHFAWGDTSVDLELKHPFKAASAERCQRIATDPVVAADFYEFCIKTVFDILFGWDFDAKRSKPEGGILGHLQAWFISNELTNRANFHAHILMWLLGGLNPGEMHAKMSDPDFQKRFFDFYEAAIFNHYPDIDIIEPDSDYKCTQDLPSMPPPFALVADPTTETAKRWNAVFQAEVKECAMTCQLHKCADVCFKYGSQTCRFNFPLEVIPTSYYDPNTQSVYARLLNEWVNYFNPVLMYCLRHNHDIKCILSGKACRAAMIYITDYISKIDLTTHQALTLLSKAVASCKDSDEPILKNAKSLLHHCLAQFTRHQQLHAQQAARLLRGKGDAISSHDTKYMLSYSLLMHAKQLLNVRGEDLVSFDDVVPIKMNNDGELSISTQVDDYLYRGDELRDMNFFDFVRLTDCVSNSQRKEQSEGKTVNRYIHFKIDHPCSTTHQLCVRKETATPFTGNIVIPQMLGCFPPRRDSASYSLFVLTHFKPWSATEVLLAPGEDADEVTNTYTFNDVALRVMKNWEQYHDCTDQRDIDRLRRKEKIKQDALAEVSKVVKQYSGDMEGTEIANSAKKISQLDSQTLLLLSLLQLAGWVDVNPHSTDATTSTSASPKHPSSIHIPTLTVAKKWIQKLTSIDKDMRNRRIHGTPPSAAVVHASAALPSSNVISSSLSSELPSSSVRSQKVLPSILPQSSEDDSFERLQYNISQERHLNEKQDLAFRAICRAFMQMKSKLRLRSNEIDSGEAPAHILMDGPGGTGKSYVINAVTAMLESLNASNALIVLAPTGNAASLINGSTIHRSLNIQYKQLDTDNEMFVIGSVAHAKRRELQAEYEYVQLLFIDEISMVSQELLADVNASLQIAKQSNLWMGGILVVYCGDLLQFPPVLATPLYKPIKANEKVKSNRHIKRKIGRIIWKKVSTVIRLTEQKRMENDADFANAVSRLRLRSCIAADVELFNTRVIKSPLNPNGIDITTKDWEGASIIVESNEARETLNLHKCRTISASMGERLVMAAARDSINKSQLTREDRTTLLTLDRPHESSSRNFMPGFVPCFIGMPVVLRYSNLYTELGITNGARGTIRHLQTVIDEHGFEVVEFAVVEFPESRVHEKNVPGLDKGLPTFHVPILPRSCSMSTTFAGQKTVTHFVRHQLPITPAFAVTGHTAQGRTMKHVITSLTSTSAHAGFAAYVAVSRVESRHGLALLEPVTLGHLNRPLPPELTEELHRLDILEHNTRLSFGLPSPLGDTLLAVPDAESEDRLLSDVSLSIDNSPSSPRKRASSAQDTIQRKRQRTSAPPFTLSTSTSVNRTAPPDLQRSSIAGPLWDPTDWTCAYDAFTIAFLALLNTRSSFSNSYRILLSDIFGPSFVDRMTSHHANLTTVTTRSISTTREDLRNHLSTTDPSTFPRRGRIAIAISLLFQLLSPWSYSTVFVPNPENNLTSLNAHFNHFASFLQDASPLFTLEFQLPPPIYPVPSTIMLNSNTYSLVAVIYHGTNHFTAAARLNGNWVYIDSACNLGRSTPLSGPPDSIAPDGRVAHLLLYVLPDTLST